MMNTIKSNTNSKWIKIILKVLFITVINITAILFISNLVINNISMFSSDFQKWFYDSRLGWFLWRILLYIFVLALMLVVNKQVDLPLKAKLLIAFSIIMIEGFNLFYLLT